MVETVEKKPRERRSHTDPNEENVSLQPNTRRLRELAPQVLGEGWQYRLAQRRGILLKTAQRWASGERSVPDEVLKDLEDDIDMMRDSEDFKALFEVLHRLIDSDADRYILSSILTDYANLAKPTTVAPRDKRYRRKASDQGEVSSVSEEEMPSPTEREIFDASDEMYEPVKLRSRHLD